MGLLSETNTRVVERRILRAVRFRFGRGPYQLDFEHGQWWVTRLRTGRQWSVVDCHANGVDYLDFELVTAGDEA